MQADQDGFLTGSNIVNAGAEDEERRAESTAVGVQNIAGDVRAIRRFLEKAGPVVPSISPSGRARAASPAPVARVHAGDIDRIAVAARKASTAQRGADGRFTAGSAGERPSVAMPAAMGLASGLAGAAGAAARIDPAVGALSELREAVSPVGRGFMALHARLAERKKERWYARILKAITGRRGEVAAGGAGGGDVQRGSFFGTMLGELGGKLLGGLGGVAGGALGFIGRILSRVFLPVAAAWAAWEVGQWIGGKVYEWLDKSGLLTKAFDAFDSTVAWFKDKFKKVEDLYTKTTNDFNRGVDEQMDPKKWAPAKLDVSGRNINDERRIDRANAVGADGRALNDPRRIDAATDGRLPEAGSFAQRAGRFVGAFKRLVSTGSGYNVVEREDGSVVKQSGARNWRNNNPGNIEFGPFAKKMGAIGSDGRFAIFPDYETGRRAKASLIFEGSSYRDLNLNDAISRYAPPTENNTGAYQRAVLKAVGGKNRRMSDYSPAERSAILDAMQRVEGFKVGTVTPMTGPVIKPAPAVATLQAIKPQSVPPSVPERVQVVQPDKTPERVGWGREDRTVVVQKEEVGQDLRDRQAAHIVTGGIGG